MQWLDVHLVAKLFRTQHHTCRIAVVMVTASVAQKWNVWFERLPLMMAPLSSSLDYFVLGSTMSQHLDSLNFEQRLPKLQLQPQ